MIPGMLPTMDIELKKSVKEPMAEFELKVFSDSHRKYASWIGGSMLASFSTFNQFIVTKQNFDDAGPNASIIMKKAF